jgi:predicted esterase
MTLEESYKIVEQSQLDYQSDQMLELIEKETALLGGNTENIFIGGFSQGCMLSLATFLKMKKEPLGGVMCFSGG